MASVSSRVKSPAITILLVLLFCVVAEDTATAGELDWLQRDPCCKKDSAELRKPALYGLMDGMVWRERRWPDDLTISTRSAGFEPGILPWVIKETETTYRSWRRIGQGTSVALFVYLGWRVRRRAWRLVREWGLLRPSRR